MTDAFNPDVHNETTFEIEAVIACLGDDAAALREENPESEIAANMERAAELLAALPTPAPTMVDSEYPPLPVDNLLFNTMDGTTYYTAEHLRAYVDADRATRPTLQSLGGDAGVISDLRSKLTAAANYIDTLGGNSKSYRSALSITSTEKSDGGTKDALRTLVEQIEKCMPVDDHGHDFTLNRAFLRAKEML